MKGWKKKKMKKVSKKETKAFKAEALEKDLMKMAEVLKKLGYVQRHTALNIGWIPRGEGRLESYSGRYGTGWAIRTYHGSEVEGGVHKVTYFVKPRFVSMAEIYNRALRYGTGPTAEEEAEAREYAEWIKEVNEADYEEAMREEAEEWESERYVPKHGPCYCAIPAYDHDDCEA